VIVPRTPSDEREERKKHKKDKDKDKKKKRKDRDGEAVAQREAPALGVSGAFGGTSPGSALPGSALPGSGPNLEVVSASQILGGSVEDLVENLSSNPEPPDAAPQRRAESRRSAESQPKAEPEGGTGDTARIFLSVGKRDGISGQVVRSLLEAEDIHPDDIDFIAVKDNHTFLGVASDLVEPVLSLLNQRAIGGVMAKAEVARPRRR